MFGGVLYRDGIYVLVEGYGENLNRRYEVRKKCHYTENGKRTVSYMLECFSQDLEVAKRMYLERIGGNSSEAERICNKTFRRGYC